MIVTPNNLGFVVTLSLRIFTTYNSPCFFFTSTEVTPVQ